MAKIVSVPSSVGLNEREELLAQRMRELRQEVKVRRQEVNSGAYPAGGRSPRDALHTARDFRPDAPVSPFAGAMSARAVATRDAFGHLSFDGRDPFETWQPDERRQADVEAERDKVRRQAVLDWTEKSKSSRTPGAASSRQVPPIERFHEQAKVPDQFAIHGDQRQLPKGELSMADFEDESLSRMDDQARIDLGEPWPLQRSMLGAGGDSGASESLQASSPSSAWEDHAHRFMEAAAGLGEQLTVDISVDDLRSPQRSAPGPSRHGVSEARSVHVSLDDLWSMQGPAPDPSKDSRSKGFEVDISRDGLQLPQRLGPCPSRDVRMRGIAEAMAEALPAPIKETNRDIAWESQHVEQLEPDTVELEATSQWMGDLRSAEEDVVECEDPLVFGPGFKPPKRSSECGSPDVMTFDMGGSGGNSPQQWRPPPLKTRPVAKKRSKPDVKSEVGLKVDPEGAKKKGSLKAEIKAEEAREARRLEDAQRLEEARRAEAREVKAKADQKAKAKADLKAEEARRLEEAQRYMRAHWNDDLEADSKAKPEVRPEPGVWPKPEPRPEPKIQQRNEARAQHRDRNPSSFQARPQATPSQPSPSQVPNPPVAQSPPKPPAASQSARFRPVPGEAPGGADYVHAERPQQSQARPQTTQVPPSTSSSSRTRSSSCPRVGRVQSPRSPPASCTSPPNSATSPGQSRFFGPRPTFSGSPPQAGRAPGRASSPVPPPNPAAASSGSPPPHGGGSRSSTGGGPGRPTRPRAKTEAGNAKPQPAQSPGACRKSVDGLGQGVAADQEALRALRAEMHRLRRARSPDDRKKHFFQLCFQWHPDKNPNNTEIATKGFQMLQEQKSKLLAG